MLPAFIRYSVINSKEDQITESINILSNLFNLYEIFNDHNYSLVSPRTEEYQKSFETMVSKLQRSGVYFSKDRDAIFV